MSLARTPGAVRLLRLAFLLPLLGGCTAYGVRSAPVAEVLREDQPDRILITLGTDRVEELFGPTLAGDSLRGHPRATSVERLAFPLASITSVSTRRFSLKKTALFVAGIGGGLALYQLLMSANNTGF